VVSPRRLLDGSGSCMISKMLWWAVWWKWNGENPKLTLDAHLSKTKIERTLSFLPPVTAISCFQKTNDGFALAVKSYCLLNSTVQSYLVQQLSRYRPGTNSHHTAIMHVIILALLIVVLASTSQSDLLVKELLKLRHHNPLCLALDAYSFLPKLPY